MADVPDFIPDAQMEAMAPTTQAAPTDTLQPGHTPASVPQGATTPDFIPDDQFVSDEDKYGGVEGQIKAGLHGLAKGLVGDTISTAAETKLLGRKPEDIEGYERENPITSGVSQAAGFGAGMLTGTGEAALLGKAGEAVAGLTAAGKAGTAAFEAAPLLARIGSSAVQQATEMAIMGGDDALAQKLFYNPDETAEQAIGHIGLSAAMGGAGGAFITGAVSPLWKATVGPKVSQFLEGVTNRINGEGALKLPTNVQAAFDDLGLEAHPALKAAFSGDPQALGMAQDLYRAQNPAFLKVLNDVPEQAKQAVADGLGVSLDDAAVFSNKESGEAVLSSFKDAVNREYEPLAQRLNARNAEAALIPVADESRMDFASRLMEKAITGVGTDAPQYKIYSDYAQRVLAKDNIAGLDKLSTELHGYARSQSTSLPDKQAYNDIRALINEFKEKQISSSATELGEKMFVEPGLIDKAARAKAAEYTGPASMRAADELGADAKGAIKSAREEGKSIGADIINERADVNRNYAQYAAKLDDLMSNLGVGDWKGTGSLMAKLDDLSAESVLKKFSTKGDAASAEFLTKNFPDVANIVREHEAKSFLAPSVKEHLGVHELDLKNLSKRVADLKKGSPEFAKWVLQGDAEQKIQSAKVLQDAVSQIKAIKDSGTPGGMGHVFKHLGAGAIGAAGWVMGHNPVSSALVGELAQRLGKDLPESYKYAMLKFLSSDQPINAGGFKAAIDVISNMIKGESAVNKAVESVFKVGANALSKEVTRKDIDKLDKQVSASMQDQNAKLYDRTVNSDVGHYLPDHQTSIATSTTKAVDYLKTLKPQELKPNPFDKGLPPSPQQVARYERALTIAQNPNVVLEHVKHGTLQLTDIQDMGAMYPKLYSQMQQKLTTQMVTQHQDGEPVPYKTRVSLGLFLQQPLDSTMTPQAIMSAQPKPVQSPQQQAGGKGGKHATGKLGKSIGSYKTASQEAESDRSDRS